MPVSAWNRLAIFCAVPTGVEVYQVTTASFFAAARSTGSAPVWASAGRGQGEQEQRGEPSRRLT